MNHDGIRGHRSEITSLKRAAAAAATMVKLEQCSCHDGYTEANSYRGITSEG